MSNPKECPKCGAIASNEFGKRQYKEILHGIRISYFPVLGLRCPKCNHLFRNPVETKVNQKLLDMLQEI